MNGLESFTCETGEHHWGGYADAQSAGTCHQCETKGTARHEYVGKAAAPQRPAKPRQAPPAPKPAAAPQGGSECPLCGFHFTRPQARCSNKAACEKRQLARGPQGAQPLDRLMADIGDLDLTPKQAPPTRRHSGISHELDLDSLADRLNHDQELRTALIFPTDDPTTRRRVADFRARVAKLEAYGDTDNQRLEAVLNRAIELAGGDTGPGPWEVTWTHQGYRTEKRTDSFPSRKDALEFVLSTPEVRRNGYSLRKAS